MFKHTIIKRSLPAGLVIAAASFPAAAQARFELNPSAGASQSPAPMVSAPSASTSSSGFQWADAGIGAAGAVLLIGGGAGAAGGLRRRRAHRPATG